ncbi:MAG: response regulator [Magnetococcales bacterium]|nr:response regulator [Magnetococcales bacterium]
MEANYFLVHDDPIVMHSSMSALNGMGTLYRVLDGAYAIAMSKDNKPDLILLDAQMPGMDGLASCMALEADFAMQDASIIFVTAPIDSASATRALGFGTIDLICKPFRDENDDHGYGMVLPGQFHPRSHSWKKQTATMKDSSDRKTIGTRKTFAHTRVNPL